MRLPFIVTIKKCLFVTGAMLLFLCTCTGCGTGQGSVHDMERESEETTEEPVTKEETEAADSTDTAVQGEAEEISGEDHDRNRRKTGGPVALVIGTGPAMDDGYNQAAFEGVQSYAQSAGVTYACYSAETDSLEGYEEAVLSAIEDGAQLVVCAGSYFEQAVGSLQNRDSDIYFLLLDGVPKDGSGHMMDIAPNVHCTSYDEEEAGYLAGYMAVLEGYTRLGFIGGGRQFPSVCRYGYGYIQGIDDAAVSLGIGDEVSVDYWYADTFLPNEQIEETALAWYTSGTEIIFACGGVLYQSVLASAQVCDGRLIGADVDQSSVSELFLTSAVKGIRSSVITALDDFYASAGIWPEELAGQTIAYGAEKKCIELPSSEEAWRFEHVSTDDYLRILADLKTGKIQVSDEIDICPETTVSVIYHDQ